MKIVTNTVVLMVVCCTALLVPGCKQTHADGMSLATDRIWDGIPDDNGGKSELIKYVTWLKNPDNGLVLSKRIGEFTFIAQYKPLAEMTLMEFSHPDSVTPEKYKNTYKEYEGMQYITFRILSNNGNQELLKEGLTSSEEYNKRLDYFAFQMQKDIKLIEGKDTLPCKLFHFERVFGVAPHATFSLGFDEHNTTADKTLMYDDSVFHSGRIYLTFNHNQLKEIPELKIK